MFTYKSIFEFAKDTTEYIQIAESKNYIQTSSFMGKDIVIINPEALRVLAKEAMREISFYLRPSHLKKVAHILGDPEASDNDRYVAATLIRNSIEAAKGILPTCQDTGTAIIYAKKGESIWTNSNDSQYLSQGIYETFNKENLRYSQMSPLSMFDEVNTSSNLPAQIDILSVPGDSYHFLFLAKGGGSANKTFLFQKTKSLLNQTSLMQFLNEKLFSLGTAACPPYHIAVVIGGTSAEANLKAVKLSSTGYYDHLRRQGGTNGQAFRDKKWENILFKMAQDTKIGAQFGGKYLAHDIRVIRLPRHAASCPVGIGVSCSADRNIKAKITAKGIFLEKLEHYPQKYEKHIHLNINKTVKIDLNQGMNNVLKNLHQYSVGQRLSLNGTIIVARDIAHAKIKERFEKEGIIPNYFKQFPIYYAGPAKTPIGMVSGSFGPTTANRMDNYIDLFQSHNACMITIAKGNRSRIVKDACKKYGGFYLGSIGGPAAILAKESIVSVELVDFEDLGMEAIRKIEVTNFPAFILCDNKGNDFFDKL